MIAEKSIDTGSHNTVETDDAIDTGNRDTVETDDAIDTGNRDTVETDPAIDTGSHKTAEMADDTAHSGISIEEYLNINGEIIYRTNGTSMNPIIISGYDLVRIVKNDGTRFHKYDTVLYKKPKKRYVLHRIVKVREKDYVILGDNCVAKEYGIRDSEILGVLTEIIKPDGRVIKADGRWMKIYSRVWYFIYPIRKFLKQLRRIAGRVVGELREGIS